MTKAEKIIEASQVALERAGVVAESAMKAAMEDWLEALPKPAVKEFFGVRKKFPNPKFSYCPYRIINVGGSNPIKLKIFINIIEDYLKIKSKKNYLSLQKGDVVKTQSSITWSKKILNLYPKTKPQTGIKLFLDWYKSYYLK